MPYELTIEAAQGMAALIDWEEHYPANWTWNAINPAQTQPCQPATPMP